MTDWFTKGRSLMDEYFKDMGLDLLNPEIEIEFLKHEAWNQKNQIKGTPTVLVNGYQLPIVYKIEDLRYFTEFSVSIK
jgi:protein-disulfide isomerase